MTPAAAAVAAVDHKAVDNQQSLAVDILADILVDTVPDSHHRHGSLALVVEVALEYFDFR